MGKTVKISTSEYRGHSLSAAERHEIERAARNSHKPAKETRFAVSWLVPYPKLSLRILFWFNDQSQGGVVGYRHSEKDMSVFQAETARYFSDLVNAKTVTMHLPDGTEERLR